MNAASAKADSARALKPRYQPLVPVVAAVCAGIVLDRRLGWAVGVWWSVAGSAWIAWWFLWRRHWDRTAGAAILVAAAACAASWHHCRWNLFSANDLGFFARLREQPVCVQGVALAGPRSAIPSSSDPRPGPFTAPRSHVDIEVVSLRHGAAWEAASGRARLTVRGEAPAVRAGDRIQVFAQFARVQPARNPGEFDFAAHHRADRCLTALHSDSPACVSLVARDNAWSGRRWIDALRSAGHRLLWEWIDPHRAGIASAVLLGCREEVTAEQTEAFVETGTIHVLSISGMHVGILAGSVFWALRMAMQPRGVIVLLTAVVVAGYTLLADAQPPAVRAMVLVLIVCGAHWLRRRPLGMNSLAAAGLVVLALNPADLFRVGVQLSFLCMVVLVWFSSRQPPRDPTQAALERLVRQSQPWPVRWLRGVGRWTWESMLVGAAIWAATTPLVAARFHVVSPIALILGPLVWLPMAAALWSGFAALLAGMVCRPMAPVPGFCCDLAIGSLQGIVEGARRLPASFCWVPGPADWWLVGLYAWLGALLAWPRLRPPPRWFAAIVAVWVGLGVGTSLWPPDRPRLVCTFASVGHGSGVVVRSPSGATLLYDAGSLMSPDRAARGISACLWSQGVARIDALVISHADADHFNAVPMLLERFAVKAVYVPSGILESDKPAVIALREAIDRAGVPLRKIAGNDRLYLAPRRRAVAGGGPSAAALACDECRVDVLHPPRGGVLGSANAHSVVLAIECQGRRVLLTGDLEGPGLEDFLKEEPWPCDVLMAPHHGNQGSHSPRLLQWSRPRLVVISGSMSFSAEATTEACRRAGADVLHTADRGAITVRLAGDEFDVQTRLPPKFRPADHAWSARQ